VDVAPGEPGAWAPIPRALMAPASLVRAQTSAIPARGKDLAAAPSVLALAQLLVPSWEVA
jgi:hypothetical protein